MKSDPKNFAELIQDSRSGSSVRNPKLGLNHMGGVIREWIPKLPVHGKLDRLMLVIIGIGIVIGVLDAISAFHLSWFGNCNNDITISVVYAGSAWACWFEPIKLAIIYPFLAFTWRILGTGSICIVLITLRWVWRGSNQVV